MLKQLRLVALAGLLAAMPVMAWADEQYVDESGYAVSGYDVVAYRSLEQAPVGEPQPQAVPGKADFTAEYNGATWAFASAENRDKFLENPEYYAPQYGGHCAYGVSDGPVVDHGGSPGKVPANPHLWRIVDDKLYLNINAPVVSFWEKNIDGNIETGDTNWQNGLESAPASTNPVPSFDPSQAPLG